MPGPHFAARGVCPRPPLARVWVVVRLDGRHRHHDVLAMNSAGQILVYQQIDFAGTRNVAVLTPR